jgi:hypothetical protein
MFKENISANDGMVEILLSILGMYGDMFRDYIPMKVDPRRHRLLFVGTSGQRDDQDNRQQLV